LIIGPFILIFTCKIDKPVNIVVVLSVESLTVAVWIPEYGKDARIEDQFASCEVEQILAILSVISESIENNYCSFNNSSE